MQDPVSGNYIPSAKMWTLFYPGAYNMGKYYDKYTAGGFYIDKSWRPNDGMVNTVSAFYPIHSDGTCLTKDGRQGWTNYDGYSNINFRPASGTSCPCSHLTTSSSSAVCSTAASSRRTRSTAASWRISTAPIPRAERRQLPVHGCAESRWSYPYIREMYEAGVIDGMTPTTFEPAGNVTRAQFVKMLALLQSADVSAYASGPFTDVPGDAWYARYVNWAAANAIVNGTSETTFDPNAAISRQDMAVMLYNYAQRYDVTLNEQTVTPFTDESALRPTRCPPCRRCTAPASSAVCRTAASSLRHRDPRAGLRRAVHALSTRTQTSPGPRPGDVFVCAQVSARLCDRCGRVSRNLTSIRI